VVLSLEEDFAPHLVETLLTLEPVGEPLSVG
jgi:purine nucleosidase